MAKQIKSTHVAYFSLMSTFLGEFWTVTVHQRDDGCSAHCSMIYAAFYTQCCCACVCALQNIQFWHTILTEKFNFFCFVLLCYISVPFSFFFILFTLAFFSSFFTFFLVFKFKLWREFPPKKTKTTRLQHRSVNTLRVYHSVMHLQVKYFLIAMDRYEMLPRSGFHMM